MTDDLYKDLRWIYEGAVEREAFNRLINNFISIRYIIETRHPEVQIYRLHQCADVAAERKKSKRAFMHVGHKPSFVCATLDAGNLDDDYQCGLFLHEFGHVLTPGGTEQDADKIIFELYGIPIVYKGEMNLEWVDSLKIFPNRRQ